MKRKEKRSGSTKENCKDRKGGSKENKAILKSLSVSIGDFIRYWGFRRIHGAIWTQLYLSKKPLSCSDLARRLTMSKSLISPALEELSNYKLIIESESPNEKVRLYTASKKINQVIRHVLKTREAIILEKINVSLDKLNHKVILDNDLDTEQLESLKKMVTAANLMLEIMLNQDDLMKLPMEIDH